MQAIDDVRKFLGSVMNAEQEYSGLGEILENKNLPSRTTAFIWCILVVGQLLVLGK